MKRNRLLFAGLFFLIFAFSSCEEMVTEIDAPSVDAKYVIESFISPEDSTLIVRVGKTNPLFSVVDGDNTWINDVVVDVNGQQLTRESNSNVFYIDASAVNVQPGAEYTVTLTYQSVVVSGMCTVPLQRNTSLSFDGYDSIASAWDEGYYDYYVKWSFQDFAGVENYYRVGLIKTWVDEWDFDTVRTEYYPEMTDYLSDIEHDGEEITGRMYLHYGSSLSEMTHLDLLLYTSDKAYYDYHRAVLNYSGENPFSEPVIIPTNVEGGLGCVAGVRRYEIQVF